jgi:hypothetical protein
MGQEFKEAESISKYGFYYEDLGRIRILVAQDRSAVAEVIFSCEEMNVGDILIPNESRVVPNLPPNRPIDKLAPPTSKTPGRIIMSKDFRFQIGKGNTVYIDAGQKKNVLVGDVFRVFRHFDQSNVDVDNRNEYKKHQREFKEVRKIVGELVVLRVEANTSTALVTNCTEEILVGDEFEQE